MPLTIELQRNPDLEAAIAKDPENTEAYLVYADWLNERDDPRGRLIMLQHQLRRQRLGAVVEEERQLRSDFFVELYGPMPRRHTKWFYGFARETQLYLHNSLGNPCDENELRGLFGTLARNQSARVLRELQLQHWGGDKPQLLIDVFCEQAPAHETLTHLTIRENVTLHDDLIDLSGLLDAYPRLSMLDVSGRALHANSNVYLGVGVTLTRGHDTLRELRLSAAHVKEGLRFPQLEEMTLVLRRKSTDALDALLTAECLPRLQSLVVGADHPDIVVPWIAHHARLPELEYLQVVRGVVDDDVLRILAGRLDEFPKLRTFHAESTESGTDVFAHIQHVLAARDD